MKRYTMGSLFDGSGGFPLAASLCGIEPVWASEIEPFCISVTKKNFPNMKHLGNVLDVHGDQIEPVDLITFGSPCQDLSLANNSRQGLSGSRSNLFMEAVRIIKEMREATNGIYPRFAFFENVPGAFSAGKPKGEDFRIILEELLKVIDPTIAIPRPPGGAWSTAGYIVGDGNFDLAWRVLDAQWWGVPQRRRRIHLIVSYRGKRAGKILFEREGLSRNFAEIAASWKTATGNPSTGIGRTSYGVPLNFRPENTKVYEETATTVCNGTNPGHHQGLVTGKN